MIRRPRPAMRCLDAGTARTGGTRPRPADGASLAAAELPDAEEVPPPRLHLLLIGLDRSLVLASRRFTALLDRPREVTASSTGPLDSRSSSRLKASSIGISASSAGTAPHDLAQPHGFGRARGDTSRTSVFRVTIPANRPSSWQNDHGAHLVAGEGVAGLRRARSHHRARADGDHRIPTLSLTVDPTCLERLCDVADAGDQQPCAGTRARRDLSQTRRTRRWLLGDLLESRRGPRSRPSSAPLSRIR